MVCYRFTIIPGRRNGLHRIGADASKPDDEVDKLNTSVFSNASVQELPADFPTAPTELVAEPDLKSIQLQWDEVQSADSYSMYRADIPGGPYTLQQEGITTTSYTDPNLTVGKTYYYAVKASNDHGTSFYSNEASAAAEGEPETIYYMNDDFEDIEINTTPASYTVLPDPQTNDLKVVVTQIPTGTTGNASAKALMLYDNGAGIAQFARSFPPQRGSFVFEADIMSQGWPGTSTVLQLQNGTGSRAALSIELRKPSAPVAEDQYTLIYKKDGKDHKLMDAPVNNQWYNFKIVGNVASQKADIYVDDVRVADDVPFQADVTADGVARMFARTPGTGKGTLFYDNVKLYVEPVSSPKGLRTEPGNGMVRLHWEEADGASTYNVKRSIQSANDYELIASELTETTYIDEEVTNGTAYTYVVTAVGPLGESSNSNTSSVTPSEDAVRPDMPENLMAVARNAQADLTWDEVVAANYYTVKRSLQAEGPYTTVSSRAAVPTFRDGGLDNGTTYYYVVSATGIGGEGEDSSPVAVTPTMALSTPQVTVESLPESVSITWKAIEGASTYVIKRAMSVTGTYDVIADQESGTSYVDTGLLNGKPYYYKVTALAQGTRSLDSSAVGTRPAVDDGRPQAPSEIRAEPGESTITLTWQEAEEAEEYAVKRSESPEGPFVTVASNVNDTSFSDTQLINGTAYYYVITGLNEFGESMSSAPISEIPAPVLTVSSDGSAQYEQVQEAIHAVPDNSTLPTIIRIKDGIYREKLDVPSSKNICESLEKAGRALC
ncbi:pectinesterase family protein [Paenibacillus amylolyticus]|nr:pectinesterase family protein [Paenibacillus amylolyticus]WFR60930.1 pectinesterase family protein [Paenibacillus amylolyticus]